MKTLHITSFTANSSHTIIHSLKHISINKQE